jgi:hypothetical protein
MKKQKDTSKGALAFCITTIELALVALKKRYKFYGKIY